MDNENDLLLPEKQLEIVKNKKNNSLSDTIKYLKEQGALDSDIQSAREFVEGFNPDSVETFDDGLIYRAYYVARKCRTASFGYLAKRLRMSTQLLKYYCEQNPKLALAIQMGYMDSVDCMKEDLVNKLYEAAMGTTLTTTSRTQNYITNDAGEVVPTTMTETTHTAQIAPNVSAQLELLKRLDPAWVPKVGIDVRAEINENLHVVQDINVQVDYKKLSVSALKELLQAGKSDETHVQSTVTESGINNTTALKRIYENRKTSSEDSVKPSKPKQKRGRAHNILNAQENIINETKRKLKMEDSNNVNKTSNRGRKKKDS